MYHRYVILLNDLESEGELQEFPELLDIVRQKVKPGRDILGENPNNIPLKRKCGHSRPIDQSYMDA
jgi:hypothetical protein